MGGVFNSAEKTEISWFSLSKDSDFKSTYSNADSVGKKYGQYLTSANAKNKGWWEESFKQYQKDVEPAKRTITAAYSSSVSKALNKICEQAYKTNATDKVVLDGGETVVIHALSTSMLKYCSPINEIPKIIPSSDNTYPNNSIGKQGYEKNLVSVINKSNDGFWKAQQEWFKDQGKSPNQLNAYFGKFFEGNSGSKTLKEGKDIKTICAETYKKVADNSTTSEKPTIDNVVKYCSFRELS